MLESRRSPRKGIAAGASLVAILCLSLADCRRVPPAAPVAVVHPALSLPDPLAPIADARTPAEKIVNGAKEQVRRGVRYDPSYYRIAYPGGDPPADRGACTDVIVRALRAAGQDLQALIHEEIRANFRRYPQQFGASRPDPNIDHRRVPNQVTFMRRHALSLPTATTGPAKETWQPGDLVYWRLPTGQGHCGVISDVRGPSGLPLVLHNIAGASQEDCLIAWPIMGHFRFPRR